MRKMLNWWSAAVIAVDQRTFVMFISDGGMRCSVRAGFSRLVRPGYLNLCVTEFGTECQLCLLFAKPAQSFQCCARCLNTWSA